MAIIGIGIFEMKLNSDKSEASLSTGNAVVDSLSRWKALDPLAPRTCLNLAGLTCSYHSSESRMCLPCFYTITFKSKTHFVCAQSFDTYHYQLIRTTH